MAVPGSRQPSGMGTIADEEAAFNKCWDLKVAPGVSGSISADSAAVYFSDTDGRLQAVDLGLAAKLWSSDLGGEVISNLFLTETSIFLVTATAESAGSRPLRKLRSISKQTGITNWSVEITSAGSTVLGSLTGSIVSVSLQGDISAFERETGALRWTKNLGVGIATEPYFEARTVLVGTAAKKLIRLDIDGVVSPVADLKNLPSAVFSDADGRILSGDERGNLLFLNSVGRRSWRFRNGARVSHIVPYDSEYIVASYDNFIYKLSRSGDVEWKRRLSGRLFFKPLVVGNVAVSSIVGDGDVYVISLADGKIVNRIATGEGNSVRVARTGDGHGFALASAAGIVHYSQNKCPGKLKDGPPGPS